MLCWRYKTYFTALYSFFVCIVDIPDEPYVFFFLSQALDKITSERTIVFCNTIDQCRRVENILQRDDRSCKSRTVLSYHGAIEGSTRYLIFTTQHIFSIVVPILFNAI